MSRDYTPHEWHDHYNARASEAQRDADRTRAAADQADDQGKNARAAYLRAQGYALEQTAEKYRECARRSGRLAERLDEQRRAYGRAQRGELHA